MKSTDSERLKKMRSTIIDKLENSTVKSFTIQMISTTVLTYLAAIAILVFIDLFLYKGTVGGINLLGFLAYFISSSLLAFIPIAIFSTIIVLIMINPIRKVMKRNESGETISEEAFMTARRRSARIPQIIFIVNIIFPIIIALLEGSFSGSFGEGIILLLKNISVFILAGLAQNAIYQRILSKPRAIMKVYTIDETVNNWFVKHMSRIQLFASILFITAVMFHSAMTFMQTLLPPPPGHDAQISETAGADNAADSLSKMREKMDAAKSGNTAEEMEIENASGVPTRLMSTFALMILLSFAMVLIVDNVVHRANKTQTRILRHVLRDMAEGSGDLTKRVLIVQADDTGELSQQLNKVLDRLQIMFRHITEQTEQVAASSNAVSSVLEGTVAATEEMAASVSQINSNTTKNQDVVLSSQESLNAMLQSLDQINANVNTQAAYVEQTSSAMTEMIANIQSVNEVTKQANELSIALKNVSDGGGQAVLNSISAVKDIEESSNEVNNLVQIISRILAATNMLAMNAAIEAAHAGDAGRGFAVVAEEVRNLADDSSSNLKTISENIKDVIIKVNRGVDLSETAGGALNEVSEKTEQTTRLMNEVASAMQEQSAGANEVLGSINSLVEASGSITRLSDEQQQNNEKMKNNLEKTVNAFAEVQSATAELDLGNREILNGIDELKEVIDKNESVVAALQQELKGFKI